MKADYLIVGQGIAGSVLAWTLHQHGFRVLILNDSTRPSASKVSAGIFNPLTGKKLSHTWKSEELFPYAAQFYEDMQNQLGEELVHYTDIYRPFRTIEEQNRYISQTAEPSMAKYVLPKADDSKFSPFIENRYGGLQISSSGWVNCQKMTKKIALFFDEKRQYIEGEIKYKSIEIEGDSVFYEGIEIKKILFCEGYEAHENPFFGWLPFNPVKGQSLIVQMNDYPITEIINQGTFVLPLEEKSKFRIGASYTWHDIDWEIDDEARELLEEKVKGYLKTPYQIVEQNVGIRPATKDQRPFVGLHPEFTQLGIFNGLGTKGVTLAPFFAQQFAHFLASKEELDPEVNIERYFSLYFRSEKS